MRSLLEKDGVKQFSVARQVVLGFRIFTRSSTPIDRPNQFATGEILKRFEAISFIHSDGSVDMCF